MRTHEEARVTRDESLGSLLLWIGVLTGPIAWLTHLVVNYSLEEWFACSPSATTEGMILGLGVRTIVMLVNVVLLAATLGAGVAAVGCWRRLTAHDAGEGGRARWMALAGIMHSLLYGFMIVVGFAPPFFLNVCQTVP